MTAMAEAAGAASAQRRAAAKPLEDSAANLPMVVGVGASAGGLEAFTQLLQALPVDSGMAFVLVQHLEATHESMLPRLLARATEMPVEEVREETRVLANHVYVIPANADLSLMHGLLRVLKRTAPKGRHLPIDYFFRTLAEAKGPRAIGVILSGTASDGTEGLKAIKVAGGITFAQSPDSAKFDGMPRSAIAAGCVDLIASPQGIATELAHIAEQPYAMRPEVQAPSVPQDQTDWSRLFRLLRTASGVDFTLYKKPTLERRLARRMTLHKMKRMGPYLKLLEEDHKEIEALFQEILIHVTGFFRDPGVFVALRKNILPRLMTAKQAGAPLRIWVPGCSTGEEAYSIAICLLEYLGKRAADTQIQIFATDADEAAIEKAREGRYPQGSLREVSPHRLQRFFTRVDGHYEVTPSVRELCVFARHDVTKDPPFSRLDLISCRNVLIYFETPLQKKVLSSFHYALNSHGVLLLGESESPSAFAELFTATDRSDKFFVKNIAARTGLDVYQAPEAAARQDKAVREPSPGMDLEKEADRIVWERYGHAGLVINDDLQIVHFRGDSSSYLKPTPGKASFNVLRMVRQELAGELRTAVQKARKSGASVRTERIAIGQPDEAREIGLEVRPFRIANGGQRFFLILFEEAGRGVKVPYPLAPAKGKAVKGARGFDLQRLREELTRTREHLEAVIEDQDSTNEELKATNEEALSNMEELQSANEELETAKEELQSSNEELVTLNDQLQNRNTELSRLSDELNNVLKAVDIPILILDDDRKIRRFTAPAQTLLGLLPGDIGRPLSNLRLGIDIPDLEKLIAAAGAGTGEIRREVQTPDGRWYQLHIREFRTDERRVEGVVAAFLDIHELKQHQQALQKDRNLISAILDGAEDLLVVVLDTAGRIIQFNRASQEMTGYSLDEVKGRRPWDCLVPQDEAAAVKTIFQEAGGGTRRHENHWITKEGGRRLIAWTDSAVRGADGALEIVIATGIDQTARAAAQERAQESDATVHALLDTATQAILAVDREGHIMLANMAVETMFGYNRSDLIGQTIEMLVPQRLRARHSAQREQWFSQPRSRLMDSGMNLIGLRRDGGEFPIEVSLSYLRSRQGMLGVAFVSDITERKKNEDLVLDYQHQLQRLAASLISTQETGNRTLARELHDVFSQELAALAMDLSLVLKSAQARQPIIQPLTELGGKIRLLADEIHRTSRQIHPAILEELGLPAALREECKEFAQHSGIAAVFTPADVTAAIPPETSLALYRITQEALRNIREHAEATEARVRLTARKDGITLQVEDNGHGFDPSDARKHRGLGLISMQERARSINAELAIRARPGSGTMVEVTVRPNEETGETHKNFTC